MDNCIDCKYYRIIAEETYGRCYKHAPRPRIIKIRDDIPDKLTVWPHVLSDDWCGEFKLLKKENK